jgi:phosphoenolpyruvate carboxylase
VPRATVDTFFQDALIAPVLTAHPTEVQRKSILDAEHDIARLLAERDLPLTPKERAANMQLLRARVPRCGRRACCATQADRGRRDRKRPVLLPHHLPARTAGPVRHQEDDIAHPNGEATPINAAYVQMGSWIGGDRDGNPNVNGDTMQHALTRQATTILDFYLDEVHTLGAELSVSTLMVVSAELQALADQSPDTSDHRADEPYRRALIGIYARLAATARALGATNILRKEVGAPSRLPDAAAFWPTCAIDRLAQRQPRRRAGAPRLAT